MSVEIELSVNGARHRLSVEPTENLVSVLRDRLQMTGTHRDCEIGICGACTVLVDNLPVSSCLMRAVQADGKEIRTVEGLEGDGGVLHDIQRAFLTVGGVQCGYCTPGFVMTAVALLEENLQPSRVEIIEALKGNICRCTGYEKIIGAVEVAAGKHAATAHATAGLQETAGG